MLWGYLSYFNFLGQHIALNKGPSRKDYVGIICTKTNLADMAQEAIDNAKFICEDYYGLFRGPEVHLHCKKDLEFMYVPSHLSHMLFELLKNSLRAVVEQYGTECDEYPPIKLIVAQGKEVSMDRHIIYLSSNCNMNLGQAKMVQSSHPFYDVLVSDHRILPLRFRTRAAEFPGVECPWSGPICILQHLRSTLTPRLTSRTLRHPWLDLDTAFP